MKPRRIVAYLAACALLVFSLGALTACADNSKEVITKSLTEEIEQLKNPDASAIESLTSSAQLSQFEQLGLTPEEVVRALFDGFDGTVDEVVVDGKKAVATVTVSSKDFSELQTAMEALVTDITTNPGQFVGMSQSEIMEWAGQKTMEAIQGLPVVQRDPVEIEYELNGNVWEPAAGQEERLAYSMFL